MPERDVKSKNLFYLFKKKIIMHQLVKLTDAI